MKIQLPSLDRRAAPQADNLDADHTPQYIQVARVLRDRIEEGAWYPNGQCMPSSKSLAAEFNTGRNTILAACQALVKAGYLRRVGSKPHMVIWQVPAPAQKADHP